MSKRSLLEREADAFVRRVVCGIWGQMLREHEIRAVADRVVATMPRAVREDWPRRPHLPQHKDQTDEA